jgi:hypothetical protein
MKRLKGNYFHTRRIGSDIFLIFHSSQRVALQEENLFKTRNSYRKLAQRAATCYNTMHYIRQLVPEYVMPLEHFIDLFDSCIFQSEKYEHFFYLII